MRNFKLKLSDPRKLATPGYVLIQCISSITRRNINVSCMCILHTLPTTRTPYNARAISVGKTYSVCTVYNESIYLHLSHSVSLSLSHTHTGSGRKTILESVFLENRLKRYVYCEYCVYQLSIRQLCFVIGLTCSLKNIVVFVNEFHFP